MQILHKAEVAGALPSDAKPIKTTLEEMSPAMTELPCWDSRCFPDVAEAQIDLGEEKRSRKIFPLGEFSYIKRQDCVSADSNFKTIMKLFIYNDTFKNCRM